MLSFRNHKIPFISKEKLSLFHRGILIRNFINDFLLFDKIILSLKCIPFKFVQPHYVQLFNELKLWKKDLGLIVNFGLPDLDIERYTYNEKVPKLIENYDYIKDNLNINDRDILLKIRKGIQNIISEHSTGYGQPIWKRIIESELDYLRLSFVKNEIVPVHFSDKMIREYRLREFIVENRFVLAITALQDNINQSDVANMQSYLKTLSIPYGIIVDFGKRVINIRSVKSPK
jgi:GxxExxY protein